jgi:hypothetical protein
MVKSLPLSDVVYDLTASLICIRDVPYMVCDK